MNERQILITGCSFNSSLGIQDLELLHKVVGCLQSIVDKMERPVAPLLKIEN